MKTDIVMKVTPEQGRKVREIVLQQGAEWVGRKSGYIQVFIEPDLVVWTSNVWLEDWKYGYEQIDTELFINTNGNC